MEENGCDVKCLDAHAEHGNLLVMALAATNYPTYRDFKNVVSADGTQCMFCYRYGIHVEAMPYSDYIDTGSLCFKAQPPNMNPTNPPPRRMLRVGVVSAVRQH